MTIREVTIAKLQHLPESLLQEMSDFIDFVAQKYEVKTVADQPNEKLAEDWLRWFEAVDRLDVASANPHARF